MVLLSKKQCPKKRTLLWSAPLQADFFLLDCSREPEYEPMICYELI